jgi:hypothetical protein
LVPILEAIKQAQAPAAFTTRFLSDLGFKSSSDRLIVAMLKALGLLNQGGQPTERYFRYLDRSQSKRVMAEGVREAYADLFQLNVNANKLPKNEVKEKLKTLTQGQHKDSVLDKMAMTFKAFSDQADFSEPPRAEKHADEEPEGIADAPGGENLPPLNEAAFGALTYSIEIHLPESRDPAVYDALFQSLRRHLG